MSTETQLPYLTNLPIRTGPALIQKSNRLNGRKWWTVATAHKDAGVIQLTMGSYKKVTHTEYTFAVYEDGAYILYCTVINNHVSTGYTSRPYDPTKYPVELLPLFDQLIEMTLKGENVTFKK